MPQILQLELTAQGDLGSAVQYIQDLTHSKEVIRTKITSVHSSVSQIYRTV